MLWRRRELRKDSTETERILWNYLRRENLGYKFKRQYSVMNYVVDFYCHKGKLAIELDGGIHKTLSQQKYDKYRTEYLKSLGVKEIRFENKLIHENISLVLDKIMNCLPSPKIRRGTEGEVK